MWTNSKKTAVGDIAMEPVAAGDLVVDGKELKNMLSLAKHLEEEKQLEFVEEIKSLFDVGLIVENQQRRSDGGYAFVHWPDGHIELRHTADLVRIEKLETFIRESLIWHV